jgi:hypothetical protein
MRTRTTSRIVLEGLPLALCAAILVAQLAVRPIVGLADNGDYERALLAVNLAYTTDRYDERYWDFVNTEYRIVPTGDRTLYLSSDLLLARAAILLDRLATGDDLFDLRALGLLRALLYLGAIGLVLVAARPLPALARALIAVLVVLACTDVGYVAYFNSMYSEAASLVFLYLTIGVYLLVATRERAGPALFAGFYVAALLFLTAKLQNAALCLALAPLCYYLVTRRFATAGRPVALTLAVGLVAVALAYYAVFPDRLRGITLYNAVFYQLLAHSPTPQDDLAWLGLDPHLAQYAGTHYFLPTAASREPGFAETFGERVNYVKLLAFYAAHPARLLDLLERAADDAFVMRPAYLGNYERSSGMPPRAQASAWSAWSTLRGALLPRSLWFLIACWALGAALAADAHRQLRGTRFALVPALWAALLAMSVLQFGITTLGDGGLERVKQLFLFNTLMDVCLVGGGLWLGSRLWTWCRSSGRLAPAHAGAR